MPGLTAQLTEKLRRPGLRDRPELRDDFVASHPDAVVGDAENPVVRIQRDGNAQIRLVLEQLWFRETRESQLVVGIGGIGDELPQEYLLVAVQRVHHEVQQLFYFGLEAECCLPLGFGHTPARIVRVPGLDGGRSEDFKR